MSAWFRQHGFSEVATDLLMGAYPQDDGDVDELERSGVTRVLNLVEDSEYIGEGREDCAAALSTRGIEEARLGLVDFGGLASEQLERAVQVVLAWLGEGERVYVHCRAGQQRSAAVAAGVIALRDGVTLLAALELIRRARPAAGPLSHQRDDLATWWMARREASGA